MKSGFAGVGQDNHDTPGRTSASLLDAYQEAHFQNPSLKRSCSSPKERNRHVPDRIGTKEVIPPMAEMRPHRERQADRQTYYKVGSMDRIDRPSCRNVDNDRSRYISPQTQYKRRG